MELSVALEFTAVAAGGVDALPVQPQDDEANLLVAVGEIVVGAGSC
jgi:hypothetical protein